MQKAGQNKAPNNVCLQQTLAGKQFSELESKRQSMLCPLRSCVLLCVARHKSEASVTRMPPKFSMCCYVLELFLILRNADFLNERSTGIVLWPGMLHAILHEMISKRFVYMQINRVFSNNHPNAMGQHRVFPHHYCSER